VRNGRGGKRAGIFLLKRGSSLGKRVGKGRGVKRRELGGSTGSSCFKNAKVFQGGRREWLLTGRRKLRELSLVGGKEGEVLEKRCHDPPLTHAHKRQRSGGELETYALLVLDTAQGNEKTESSS